MWYMNTLKDLIIIKAFVPEKIPCFVGTEPMIDFVKWNLYERITSGLKSFDILCDNKRFYDAFLVAGNVLEVCAVLSYIKDKKTEKQRLENLNKYLARSSAGQLLRTLSRADDLSKEVVWNAYELGLKLFAPVGEYIIKKQKNGKNDKENHIDVLNKLKYRNGSNADKKSLINSNYVRPDPQGYVRAFSKSFHKIDNGYFERMYDKYCDFKHINIMSNGVIAETMDEDVVDWAIEIMAGIVLYLQRYGLDPIDD